MAGRCARTSWSDSSAWSCVVLFGGERIAPGLAQGAVAQAQEGSQLDGLGDVAAAEFDAHAPAATPRVGIGLGAQATHVLVAADARLDRRTVAQGLERGPGEVDVELHRVGRRRRL